MYGWCDPSACITRRWAAEDPECRLQGVTAKVRDHDQVMFGRIGLQLSAYRAAECIGATDDGTGENRSSPDLAGKLF